MLSHPFIARLMTDGRLVRTTVASAVAPPPTRRAASYTSTSACRSSLSVRVVAADPRACRGAHGDALPRVLQHGFLLKDATPANVLFRANATRLGRRPVDRATAARRVPVERTGSIRALLRAAVNREPEAGIPLEWSLRNPARGLDHVAVARMLGARRWLKPSLLAAVALPALAQRAAQTTPAGSRATLRNDEQARFTLGRVFARNLARIRSLQRALEPKRSMWREYTATRSHYGQSDVEKTAFVREAVESTRPAWVLDVGANTGEFSEHAAAQGAAVVAVDTDEAAVNGIFSSASRRGANVLPMVANFASPSPALGWANSETLSFLDCAEKRSISCCCWP